MKALFGGNYGLILNANEMYKEQRRFALHSLRDLGFGKQSIEVVDLVLVENFSQQKTILELAHRTVDELHKVEGDVIEIKPYLVVTHAN